MLPRRLSPKLLDALGHEISVLRRLNHPNIVRLLDIVKVREGMAVEPSRPSPAPNPAVSACSPSGGSTWSSNIVTAATLRACCAAVDH